MFDALGAPVSQDLQTAHVRQSQIQNDGVIEFRPAQLASVLAVGRPVDGKAAPFQRSAQARGEIGFVFDEQDTNFGLRKSVAAAAWPAMWPGA
jgi:hypothetical protein